MGRIKKVAGQKHEVTISPFLANFITRASTLPIFELPSHLNTFPRIWDFPRGDLYHWINVLNRFDDILASVIDKYALHDRPQTQPFCRNYLLDCYDHDESTVGPADVDAELDSFGYGPEGDRELVESILNFSRLLLEKCGNRSLYSSSDRVGDLLNTSSLSLLECVLRLGLSLAQRYHYRQRSSTHAQSLLATHYNIDLDKIQKLAASFPRPEAKHDVNDLISLMQEDHGWDDWGHVHMLYYPPSSSEHVNWPSAPGTTDLGPQAPSTPTPLRRSHTQPSPRLVRAANTEESPSALMSGKQDEISRGAKLLHIPQVVVVASKTEDLLSSYLPEIPNESRYELLHKIRLARGFTTSRSTREQILAIRILAITNAAYVFPEAVFQQKILQYDLEQPKRLQLTYQLADLVHLGASEDISVSRSIQTFALQALEALAKQKARAIDVCAALNINVNHGILMFLTRKLVEELACEVEQTDQQLLQEAAEDEWRDALFALLRTLPGSSNRTLETLVSAGLIQAFVEMLQLRSNRVVRFYSRIMEFLDIFVHTVRDAFGTLARARVFPVISELVSWETNWALQDLKQGRGLPDGYKTPPVDYKIGYFHQQTIRWLFRFVNHIMQHNGGGFDRLLRNLIDSPHILKSLRRVLERPSVYGSHVWSGAVNILSSFIHNEPTSYAVIAEAGLSKSFLEAVTLQPVADREKSPVQVEQSEGEGSSSMVASAFSAEPSSTPAEEQPEHPIIRPGHGELAPGILPSAEAISCIPGAFGAICLNASGLDLFKSSHALESFFEIFENPSHVRCLNDDSNLVRTLGSTFDELVRHHPAIKQIIMSAVIVMVARVGILCRRKAWEHGIGAKLWIENSEGKPILSGDPASLYRAIGQAPHVPPDSARHLGIPELNANLLPNGGKLIIGDEDKLLSSVGEVSEPKDEDSHGLTVTDYLFPVVRFLGAFFENQTNCLSFIESGGVEFVLDLATLQSLSFDFHKTDANQELTVLVHMLAETRPHLVLPSLIDRTQVAVDQLSKFWAESHPTGFFTTLTKGLNEKEPAVSEERSTDLAITHGTFFAKHMVAVLILTDLLREIFSTPLYNTRPSQQTSAFLQVNLADRYCSLVAALGQLQGACVWEEILLEKRIPATWHAATKVSAPGVHTQGSNEVSGFLTADQSSSFVGRGTGPESSTVSDQSYPSSEGPRNAVTKLPEDGTTFTNVQTLRYLLSSLPSTIKGFFHNLGHNLIGKKRMDLYQRQNASSVADAIADAVLRQLQSDAPNSSDNKKLKFSYLIVLLSSFSHLLFESSVDRSQTSYLTLVLFAFKRKNGLRVMREICDKFLQEVHILTQPNAASTAENEVSARLTSACGGIKIILSFFAEITSGKSIIDSNQTQSMTHSERDRDRPDFFQPGQFLVDLRMEILPMVREMWNSEFATRSSSSLVKCMVDILRSSLDGEYEAGASLRSESQPPYAEVLKRTFPLNGDRYTSLRDRGYDKDLCKEALYRCNNVYAASDEYCKAQRWLRTPSRLPPPAHDVAAAGAGTTSAAGPSEDTVLGNAPPFGAGFDRSPLALLLQQASNRSAGPRLGQDLDQSNTENDLGNGAELTQVLSQLLSGEHGVSELGQEGSSSRPGGDTPSESANRPSDQLTGRREVMTIEDLDVEREKVRSNLIERCLDILNDHHDISFELSDLIFAATRKHRDPETFRREVGETLVQSLVSLQMDDFHASGKKIAAYAHLLALILQDRDMYLATIDEVKDCFLTLLGFIKIPNPDKTNDESFPWIGHVLLILEKLLCDDAQPPQIRWNPPDSDGGGAEEPAQLEEPLVSSDAKIQLFDAVVEISPRIGKDETLALSVCRILVILTRSRAIAARLGERRNLQRLFVMMKQLSSATNEKIQSAFLLILRHIIEDEDTIRQIMRSEIVAHFEAKASRQTDTTGYVRQLYHLVLRSPEIFVEVTNEKLKLQRYDAHQRPQILSLKPDGNPSSNHASNGETQSTDKDKGNEKSETDGGLPEDTGKETKEKAKPQELKAPVIEHPDGVIHYLLSELLSYRDVDDKEPVAEAKETTTNDQGDSQTDVEMSTDDVSPSASSTDLHTIQTTKKADKPPFKADEHPIYIYRCFLLQCLTELLSSYNRTKVEFINFSRKADPFAATPSKPRSGILNYLLNVLVPVGTMEHDESVSFKKRSNTSLWAMRVLVALCSKTGEFGGVGRRRIEQEEQDEPELAFVRKFVLEHALKSFRDANASSESLDVKYARLMSLADLFDKMLSGYTFASGEPVFPSSTRLLAKTMFEKHFISALTASIADIDLNFPASKRVVKYILRPLNKLTQTAVLLSETSDITSLEDTAEDEISSATSVSDLDDEREETPDLFRHSTLGMLEPRHDEETSSAESEEDDEDDEMYDDEYGDEMDDYEDGLPEDDGEVVSEEDEDMDGMGPIEGIPGDHPMEVEVVMDEDDEDDEDEDEEDEEEDDEMDDEDEIFAGEITGDHDNESLGEGHEDEWESENESEDEEEAEMMNQLENELADIRQADQRDGAQRFDELFRVINEAAGGVEDLHDPGLSDLQDDLMDDELNEEDDDDEMEDDELDELEEDPGSYGAYDDDDLLDQWAWHTEEPPPGRAHPPHHHHRFRGGPPAISVAGFMSNRHGLVPLQPYRVQRTQAVTRGTDDGTNPLLIRSGRPTEGAARGGTEAFADWVHTMEPVSTNRLLDSPVAFMNMIMQAIGGTQGVPDLNVISRGAPIHVQINGRNMPHRVQDILGLGRPQAAPTRARDDPSQAVSFALATTKNRWQEEARILFGNTYVEKTQRVVNSLLKLLVPPAIEEEKRRLKKLEEDRKRREEEEQAEQERLQRIAREEEEKERKRKEDEEHARQSERQQEVERQGEPMADVEPAEAGGEEATTVQAAGPAEAPRRIRTTIRGRQLDITGMEIDPEYLEALPEELREEVIMQQLAEQRSQAAAAGEEPSEINQEFLEALPPDIREELLQQEAADRRRRERENARRQAAASGAPAHAEDMDAASFLATLDPTLRQAVLADQPDEILATLGPEFLSEARALTGRRFAQFGDMGRVDNRRRTEPREDGPKKQQRRQVVQMLDRAGVATLLRLMFMPLQGNSRHQLNDILHNVCENRQNRVEVVSLLLSILQDGSIDIPAIERSFAHLSLRAKTPSTQKTPQSVKRHPSYQPSAGVGNEVTPMMVVQQCLNTLSFLTQYNPHIAWFFLTEHEPSSSLKVKSLRKGKGKESRAAKFALNALMSLLDRKIIMESPGCMELLSSLLSSITQPLTLLLRREKEKQQVEDKGKKPEGPVSEESEPDKTGEPSAAAPAESDAAMTDAGPLNETTEEKHKKKVIEPPFVPDDNFRLVVRILAAPECNGKTFRDTLSTINNLSAIPGARDIIGDELVGLAQSLSTTILSDLDKLLLHLKEAKSGSDMQGLALSKFSSPSSDQAKLLRVLTALDYLFDPERADRSTGNEPDSVAKDNTLKTLYQSATFGPLWTKLSDCLTVIRHKDSMLNVATILLPLIETLMVVCKNTTLKDAPISRQIRELSTSPPTNAATGMEEVFFKFTEDHRKILNELVRQNPRLMSGTFSLLVKNPKVLEFDNKRNYFNRRLHARGAEPRHPHPPLQLSVRRDQVFLDSFKALYFKTAEEMKHGKLNIRFHGEEGVDAGGVTREWFQVLARGMFNPNYALFIPVAADRTTFHPNRLSGVNSEHLLFFKFIGRIIGKALFEGRVLDCHFSRAVYKSILGKSVSVKDMETLDLDYYKSLLWMLENDITDIITETFSIESDAFGEKIVVDLVENGRNIPVIQENKEEYVQRVVEYRLVGSVKEQLDNFLKGFFEIIPQDLISIFNEQELELLISGLPEIDVDDWKNNTEYHNYSASSSQIQWFWRAVRSFDKEERAKLLQFVTGTSKVPLNGFKELEGMNGVNKFNIHRDYGEKDRLPSSHTCFNQLDLPEYESYEDLRKRLYIAMTAGSEYFGFA